MRNTSGVQKQVLNADKQLQMNFNATTGLVQSLKKEKLHGDRPKTLFMNTGKELLQQARIEKENEKLKPKKKDSTIEQEIISLPYHKPPVDASKTIIMIERLKSNRLERHNRTIEDFDNWVQDQNNFIEQNSQDIKQDIDQFFEASDREIQQYFDCSTDHVLIKREKDLLDEMKQIVNQHEDKRNKKINGLYESLDKLENERLQNMIFFCDNLQNSLIDIAYLLEPDVIILVNVKRQQFQEFVKQKKEQNQIYVQEVNIRQKNTFVKFGELRLETEKRWKKLRHEEAYLNYQQELKTMEYINPEERKLKYNELKEKHKQIFDQKTSFLQRLVDIDIAIVSKKQMDKWSDDVRVYNDKAQEEYDILFHSIKDECEQNYQKLKDRTLTLQNRMEYIDYLPKQELEKLITTKCDVIVQQITDDAKQLMMNTIEFIESSDKKQNDLLDNIGKFYSNIGVKSDEYKASHIKMNQEYELEQAIAADDHDAKIEKMMKELEQFKLDLKLSLHHPKLNENLQICFKKIDELEVEYRRYHDQNMHIASENPNKIKQVFNNYELNTVGFFEYFDITKKKELEERNLQRAQEKIRIFLAKEEKLRQLEEDKQANEIGKDGKKGTKKVVAKKGDPKKAQQEQEQREKELLQKFGVEQIVMFTTPLGNEYIVSSSFRDIATKMYQDQEEKKKNDDQFKKTGGQEGFEQGGSQVDLELLEDKPPIPVDFKPEPPADPEGNKIAYQDVVIELSFVENLITSCQQKFFIFLQEKLDETIKSAKLYNKEYVENSVLYLDEKLKEHYPLKGNVEVNIFQTRSQQITGHKKRYDRHVRNTIEKIDLQTEKFNLLLEQALDKTKVYEKDIKNLKEQLPTGHTIAKLQGVQVSARELKAKFDIYIADVVQELTYLAINEVDQLLGRNRQFIKECTLFEDNGEYSKFEVEWYDNMIKEIDEQLVQQKNKRQDRYKEINEYMNKRNKEMFENFEAQFQITIDELQAKDGSGRKYGRPRRLAQERTRSEMNKCEKSQEAILNCIEKLKQMYDEFKQQSDIEQTQEGLSFSMKVRKILMTCRTCIGRYAAHLECIKPDSQMQEVKRVSYNENKYTCMLDQSELEKDVEIKLKELEELGPLSQQKENKTFLEWIADIEKNVTAEAIKLYVGEKSKFLTGQDKIPDYLRTYYENMNIKMKEFRIQCIRELRQSCEDLSQISKIISEMIMSALCNRFEKIISKSSFEITSSFGQIQQKMEEKKALNLTDLSPNLSKPKERNKLIELVIQERDRLQNFLKTIRDYKLRILDLEFLQSNDFFKGLLNHFEFLVMYYDAEVLFEDFVKLPGDEIIEKKQVNIKVLTRLKQNGTVIDTSSERCLQKVWPGLLIDSFAVEDKKIVYELQNAGEEQDQGKGKKGDKKAAKKESKKEEDQQIVVNTTHTKELKSYKTYRQKSAYQFRNQAYDKFLKRFQDSVQQTIKFFDEQEYKELKFEFKWQQTVSLLNNLPEGSIQNQNEQK